MRKHNQTPTRARTQVNLDFRYPITTGDTGQIRYEWSREWEGEEEREERERE